MDHFRDNPKRIDKLIAIKGLPEEWFFRDYNGDKELKKPWEPDVDKNVPYDIQSFCDPMYVIIRYPAIHKEAKEFIEKRKILGVRIDYNTEPGRQMWEDVERYVEETMPRNERVPVPVLCSRDERSAFETYTPRRNARGSLELVPSPIPFVDLTKYTTVKIEIPHQAVAVPVILEKAEVEVFKCDSCEYTHRSKQGIRMHRIKGHPKTEKVGV
jgi:hypothetical protein